MQHHATPTSHLYFKTTSNHKACTTFYLLSYFFWSRPNWISLDHRKFPVPPPKKSNLQLVVPQQPTVFFVLLPKDWMEPLLFPSMSMRRALRQSREINTLFMWLKSKAFATGRSAHWSSWLTWHETNARFFLNKFSMIFLGRRFFQNVN